ncbi:DegT/DnrJ/EryC1/StrS family aminotransferase [Streptomyces sp. 4F14]|uniref:DegT/DnrJ/EryC1/StrS family aminotransferase n=1 Tax=Streptomyces sp. 4F14 TaxID=3394380 RepID=UPI003A8AD270
MDGMTAAYLDDAIAAGGTGNAEAVRALEERLGALVGAAYTLCVSSGTTALISALYAVGVRPGARVGVSALGPSMTGLAVTALGARPVFIDCSPGSFGLAAQSLGEATGEGPLAAVVPVPMWGYWDEDPQVLADLRQRGIPVVVDAAQAPLLRLEPQGLADTADVICLSLHGRKPVKAGEGGACLTRSEALADRILAVRNFGQLAAFHGTRVEPTGPFGSRFGSNFKINGVGAAWCLSQLDDPGILRARHARLRTAARRAFDTTGITWHEAPHSPDVVEHGGYGLVALCGTPEDAARMAHRLTADGVEVDTLRYTYAPMHTSACFSADGARTPAADALTALAVACRLEAFPLPSAVGG